MTPKDEFPVEVNSRQYWDRRFASDWDAKGGPEQSRFFSRIAVSLMPSWLLPVVKGGATLLDWGCAEGDGTAELASLLPGLKVSGADFSEEAIRIASSRYPGITFSCFDATVPHELRQNAGSCDFLFTSNTLEHFQRPAEILSSLALIPTRGMIVLVPFREEGRIDEHAVSFWPENLQLLVDQFVLVSCKWLDASAIPGTKWSGEQICLVYLRIGDPLLATLSVRELWGDGGTVGQSGLLGSVYGGASSVLLGRLLESEKEMQRLSARCVDLEGRVVLNAEDAAAKARQRDALREALARENAVNEALAEERRVTREEAFRAASELRELQDRYSIIEAYCARVESERNALVARQSALDQDLEKLASTSSELAAARRALVDVEADLRDQLASMEARFTRVTSERSLLAKELEVALSRVSALESRVADQADTIEAMRGRAAAQLASAEDRAVRAESAVHVATRAASESLQQLASSAARERELAARVIELQDALVREQEKREAEVAEHLLRNKELTASHGAAVAELVASRDAAIAELMAARDAAVSERDALASHLARVEAELCGAKSELQVQLDRVSMLSEQIQRACAFQRKWRLSRARFDHRASSSTDDNSN